MRIISWNVNGLRAALKKNFLSFIRKENADVICIQETKAKEEQVELKVPRYEQIWNSAKRRGYAGTLILTKKKPISIIYGMGNGRHDDEGRITAAELEKFFIVNVYTPNSQRGLSRLKYRKKWDRDFLKFLKKLEKRKPVVFCGDLNVAHKEIDLANPQNNRRNAGFTDEEREGFSEILDSGFVDTFREFNKKPGQYTWWTYRFNARKKNIGWRIDYFCVSKSLMKKVKSSKILSKVMGSDHCPIELTVSS